MEATHWPTFGQLLQYLRALGFTVGPGRPGYVRGEHPEEGSWFVFRDRDQSTPAREVELLDAKVQLTQRGFVTEQEFARFWNQRIRITS
jgi:hypothetical protein